MATGSRILMSDSRDPVNKVLLDGQGRVVLDDGTGKNCRCGCQDGGGTGGACYCYGWWEATWNTCDGTPGWVVKNLFAGLPLTSGTCLTDDQATARGIMGVGSGWLQQDDPCKYRKATKGAACTCTTSCTAGDPGDPGGTDPACCCQPPSSCPCTTDWGTFPCGPAPWKLNRVYAVTLNYRQDFYLPASGRCDGELILTETCKVKFNVVASNSACRWNIDPASIAISDASDGFIGADATSVFGHSDILLDTIRKLWEFDFDAGGVPAESDKLTGCTPAGVYPDYIQCFDTGTGVDEKIGITGISVA